MSYDEDIVDLLWEPEEFYPGNFNTPERACAFLFGLCQYASDEIKKLRAQLAELGAAK